MMIQFASARSDRVGGRLIIDLAALIANWRKLAALSKPAPCAAVVKADAYGLGLKPVVQALYGAGCKHFFVALPEEGFIARQSAPHADIYVLNGLFANNAADLAAHHLKPVLNSRTEIDEWLFFCETEGAPFSAALHVDTGMNRLGLTYDEAIILSNHPQKHLAFKGGLLMSHLACADEPDHAFNMQQFSTFQKICAHFPEMLTSLANSAAILSRKQWNFDLTRPGIALYGGKALINQPNPMHTVVTLEGRIVQVREAAAGETVGYGAQATLKRDSRIAIVAIGYGDGFHRLAGSSDNNPGAYGWIAGTKVPLIGRVSMDMIAIDVTDTPEYTTHRGAWIELIGSHISIDTLAFSCNTIGYEVLTSLGKRFERFYKTDGQHES